jgi:hypothetical protein
MFSKIINEIKFFFKSISFIDKSITIDNMTYNNIDDLLITHKWFNEYKNNVFIDYIEKKVDELAETENIKMFSVSFDELNKDVEDDEKKALGVFYYLESKKIITYESLEPWYKIINKEVPISKVYPRIELTERSDVFIKLHELGHYFIYKRDQVQSEPAANLFIEEFFDNYLPPFFKWIYQIEIKIRGNMDLNFTVDECKQYWKQYCEFKNNFDK